MVSEPPSLFPKGAAFVAGGSGGIGSAICVALAEAGCDISLSYKNNLSAAEAVARTVTERGRRADIVRLDLEDTEAVKAAVADAATRHGAVHTAVYAAGPYVPFKYMSQVTPDQFRQFLLGDTFACYNLVHAVLPFLRDSRGSFVAVTTTALQRWAAKDGLSAVPKAGIDRLMVGIAREEGRFGVRANSVALGVIKAGMFDRAMQSGEVNHAYLEAMAINVPLQRLGEAEEVAHAVSFLASSRAAYTTGQVLRVDGGYPL